LAPKGRFLAIRHVQRASCSVTRRRILCLLQFSPGKPGLFAPQAVKEIFDEADKNKNGTIEVDELEYAVKLLIEHGEVMKVGLMFSTIPALKIQ
jgi:hypothetical protein